MNEHIDYIEFASTDLAGTRAFFERVFGWSFQEYGDDYLAFNDSKLNGGFYRADRSATTAEGAVLVVLYAEDLEQVQSAIESAGGDISKPVFDFPGGRRFHFIEPGGNELAVWSDRVKLTEIDHTQAD